MLTPEQISQMRAKAGLAPLNQGQPINFVGRFDYLLPEKKAGFIDKVKQGAKNVIDETKKNIEGIADTFSQNRNLPATALSSTAIVPKAIGDAIFEGVKVMLSDDNKEKAKKHIEEVMANPTIQKEIVEPLMKWANENPQSARAVKDVTDIASVIPAVKAGEAGGKVALEGVEQVGKTVLKAGEDTGKTLVKLSEDAKNLASKGFNKATDIIASKPTTPLKAVGQVLQGTTKDLKSGVKALSLVETDGVKTFKDLGSKIQNKISELAKGVDADLALDQTKKKLSELVISAKTQSGKLVKIKPVENALNQLEELYTKIGDVVGVADIKDLLAKAKKFGLTNQEVNTLARKYGQEFSSKAFNKMGDALTSVNAQMYENTRKALKNLARSGIKGKEAQLADEAMSSLYDTLTLIQKNVQAVNKIQQKISERGLLENIGHAVAKYGDVLTGGSIRGLVGGLLPRGAGYKVLNALDIESLLEKNLKILQDAIKSGNDAEIINILKGLERPKL